MDVLPTGAGGALQDLLDAIREATSERAWGAAVQLVRSGAVRGVSDDGEEIALEVTGRRGVHEVYLWPDDQDWGCDCQLPGRACLHVAAAAIAVNQARTDGQDLATAGLAELPEPVREVRVRIRYDLSSQGRDLAVRRSVLWPDGRIEPLVDSLAAAHLSASSYDQHAETLLAMQAPGPLNAAALRRLLALLGGDALATLDGEPVTLSEEPVLFRVRVTDAEGGFHVGLFRPAGLERLFRGAALVGGALRPTSHGSLSRDQRSSLVRGVIYGADKVALLVGEVLPRLRDQVPVDVATERLPVGEQLQPRVRLVLSEVPQGLEVLPEVVYGQPPVARVESGVLHQVGPVLPARDVGLERTAARRFEDHMDLSVGIRHVLPPAAAASFLSGRLERFRGEVVGTVPRSRFEVAETPLRPEIRVGQAGGGWSLDVGFAGAGDVRADARAVLSAWRAGRSLVALMDGGFAPLPDGWLQEHAALLLELLEARDHEGVVQREATAALVELLEGTEAEVPEDLSALRSFLEGGEGLPDPPLPEGFVAELRPYQRVGYQWLRFLARVELSGILADDMGLGKTVQALAAMAATPGPHLVVAPTSVLRNWERETHRFAPKLRVNLYHGPGRVLDLEADLVLTSYALLRLDQEALGAVHWGYAVLDEAQFIKNPASQTARAARTLRARHRLALTGTPIENRLEELWSLFRFLVPGLLGGLDTFKERFVRPIEAGDARAGTLLRRRVRPYVLRRLKRQVAADLPLLTEVVERCTLGPEQRRVYDVVRLAGHRDVQRVMEERGAGRSTMAVLEALLRMRQACCDPALLPGDVGQEAGAAKLDRLEEILVELVCEDHKVLVFSQWTSLLDRVEPRLRTLGIDWVRLEGSTRDRQGVIDRFQSDDGPPVFLLSLKAGGTGLNLTAADYVVHLDPWWNPATQQQATDRAHRIGQDRPVVSVRLVAEDTVEERIMELQDAKRHLADQALGTEGGMLRTLSSDELRSLFAG